ncbi:MAG: TetR/AcrR family transcriptional regulator [Phycisphaerales bacterium]|nr:MAG: TetR/AcrR family transcriptional regulator [Phycisphaerales bacterium]
MARMRATERRRQLLEVAAELFAQRGYRGATTAELARAAGITEPILYRHFENKLDLFVTLIDEVGREVIAAWKQALEGITDPQKRLHTLLAANPATHERGRGVYRVIFQAMTEIEGDKEIAEALRQHTTKLHAFVRTEIVRLQKAGVVRDDEPPAALAWVLIDVAVGYGILAPLGVPGQTSTARAAGIERLINDLLAPV